MSNALGCLRKVLGDVLFVRSGRMMVPTERALQPAAPITAALNQIRAVLGEQAAFNPSRSDAFFRIHCSDYAEILLSSPR